MPSTIKHFELSEFIATVFALIQSALPTSLTKFDTFEIQSSSGNSSEHELAAGGGLYFVHYSQLPSGVVADNLLFNSSVQVVMTQSRYDIDDFLINSAVTRKHLQHFCEIKDIVLGENSGFEGDICFPNGSLESEQKLNQWLARKNTSRDQAIQSHSQKQQNLVSLSAGKKNALEIGFNAGNSALIMLLNNPELKLTVVDIATHSYTLKCFDYLDTLFAGRITLICGNSLKVLPSLRSSFDFIHVDGGHTIEVASSDLNNSDRLLGQDGFLLFDDTQAGFLRKLVVSFAAEKGYSHLDLVTTPPLMHMAFQKKSGAECRTDAPRFNFNAVYQRRRWGIYGNGSGPGSTVKYSRNAINYLADLIRRHDIRSITDVSCGGMAWWPEVLDQFTDIKFTGIDIAASVVAQNSKNFRDRPNWTFLCRDAVNDALPQSDLMICRHTMMHLGLDDCSRLLSNMQRSGSKLLLLTTHPNIKRNRQDKRPQLLPEFDNMFEYQKMNLSLPPFSLNMVDSVAESGNSEEKLGLYLNKSAKAETGTVCVVSGVFGANYQSLYPAPSNTDSFLITNNTALHQTASAEGWTPCLSDMPLSRDLAISSIQSKSVKFLQCLQLIPNVDRYSTVVYVDHKFALEQDHVDRFLDLKQGEILIRLTPRKKTNVWDEFNESLLQTRYRKSADGVKKYVSRQIRSGLEAETPIHNTGLIVYNIDNPAVLELASGVHNRINALQSPHCQIIWAMESQRYRDLIQAVDFDLVSMKWKTPV